MRSLWVTQSMALPEPFPWASQNISAFLGCYFHVFYWCWMYAGFESLHCTTCNCGQFCAAGGGVCCSISSCSTCAIAPAHCWTYCGNFFCSGERNCAWTGQTSLIPAESLACGPWLPAAAQSCLSGLLWPGAPASPFEWWELICPTVMVATGYIFSLTPSGCLECNYLYSFNGFMLLFSLLGAPG